MRRERAQMVRALVRYGQRSLDELAQAYDHEIEGMVERLKLEVIVPDTQPLSLGEVVGGE